MTAIDSFIEECREQQPDLLANYLRFFDGVIALPVTSEMLLQAYLAYNFKKVFGVDGEPILYESPLPGTGTNSGKLDFVYLLQERGLLAIETKYIDLKENGKTACDRRRKQRSKVISQAKAARGAIAEKLDFSSNDIRCGVFSNDEKTTEKARADGIDAYDVSTESLIDWRKKEYKIRFG